MYKQVWKCFYSVFRYILNCLSLYSLALYNNENQLSKKKKSNLIQILFFYLFCALIVLLEGLLPTDLGPSAIVVLRLDTGLNVKLHHCQKTGKNISHLQTVHSSLIFSFFHNSRRWLIHVQLVIHCNSQIPLLDYGFFISHRFYL